MHTLQEGLIRYISHIPTLLSIVISGARTAVGGGWSAPVTDLSNDQLPEGCVKRNKYQARSFYAAYMILENEVIRGHLVDEGSRQDEHGLQTGIHSHREASLNSSKLVRIRKRRMGGQHLI